MTRYKLDNCKVASQVQVLDSIGELRVHGACRCLGYSISIVPLADGKDSVRVILDKASSYGMEVIINPHPLTSEYCQDWLSILHRHFIEIPAPGSNSYKLPKNDTMFNLIRLDRNSLTICSTTGYYIWAHLDEHYAFEKFRIDVFRHQVNAEAIRFTNWVFDID